MAKKNEIPLEKSLELIQRVQREIENYKAGTVRELTPNKELASLYDVSQTHINYLLYNRNNMISREDLLKRAKQLFSQSTKKRKPHQGHKKLSGKTEELVGLITREITDFKEGRIKRLSTNSHLAESYQVCSQTIADTLSENIDKESIDYRRRILFQQTGHKSMSQLTPEQRVKFNELGYKAGLAKFTKEQRVGNGRKGGIIAYPKGLALLSAEQRIKNARKGSLSGLPKEQRIENLLRKSQRTPNNLEYAFINSLEEHGLYVPHAKNAQSGQIYYTGLKGNNWFKKLEDGRFALPDFKVKGQPKVIEINGCYWHSEEFCREKGLPDYKWIPERLIEEYAKKGIECKVYRESDIRDKKRLDVIVQEIKMWLEHKAS